VKPGDIGDIKKVFIKIINNPNILDLHDNCIAKAKDVSWQNFRNRILKYLAL
jgi:glycosyltransferase involved in cell wall biosynthesis